MNELFLSLQCHSLYLAFSPSLSTLSLSLFLCVCVCCLHCCPPFLQIPHPSREREKGHTYTPHIHMHNPKTNMNEESGLYCDHIKQSNSCRVSHLVLRCRDARLKDIFFVFVSLSVFSSSPSLSPPPLSLFPVLSFFLCATSVARP